ncbi:MAG: PQQ-binding-like beta-propeller repeat protein [Chloroflexota bacterium]
MNSGNRRFVLGALAVVGIVALAIAAFYLVGAAKAPVQQTVGQHVSPDDWPEFMYDGGRSGFNRGETRLSPDNAKDLKLLWRKKVGDGNVVAAQPIVFSNTLYVGSWDGFLYALNPGDGSEIWKKDLGRTTSKMCVPDVAGISSAPAVTKDALYIGGGDDKFYALNPNNGETLWSFKTGDNSEQGGSYNWPSPLVYKDRVYTGISSFCDRPFMQGGLWGLNAATGQTEQQVRFVPDNQKGGGIWTSPTIDEATGSVFVTTGSGDYYIPHSYSIARLDPQTLEVKDAWQIPIEVQVFDGDWGTTPTLFRDKDGALMVGAAAKNGYYYAFKADDIHSGPAWSAHVADGGSCPQCGEGAISSSAYAYDTVYVAAGYVSLGQVQKFPGSVTALDPTMGAVKWMHPTSGWVIPALTVANGLVVAGAEDTIEVINAVTGDLLWEYATGGALYAPATIAGGVIYAASTDGYLYAFSAGPYPAETSAYAVGTVGANPPPFTPFRTPVAAEPLEGAEQCFDNKLCVHGAFLKFWQYNGGLNRFGPPATGELNEAGRTVQYFRNAVLLLYMKEDGTPDVRQEGIDYRLAFYSPLDSHFDRADAIPGATYAQETGHNIPEPFNAFWQANGTVGGLGYPLSEPLSEYNVVDGQTHRAQYFERARLELVTGADGAEHVEIGAIGLQKYLQRYGKLP